MLGFTVSLTASETRALLVSGILIVVATVARATWLRQESESWSSTARSAAPESLLAEARARRARDARRGDPLSVGERLDVNRATDEELDRLPGVGLGLAREIVHFRAMHGLFVWAEDLERVPGIGPAVLDRIRDRITLPPRPEGSAPSIPRPPSGPILGETTGAPPPVDLNRASAEELTRVPGIGPKRAAQIVALREARRGFRSVDDLLDVPGIGPRILAKIQPFVRVSP